jgi:small subunit ribosomal protein S8
MPTIRGGMGINILSTPEGVMVDREAVRRNVGGEVLCSVW